jgi:hypothetical protein
MLLKHDAFPASHASAAMRKISRLLDAFILYYNAASAKLEAASELPWTPEMLWKITSSVYALMTKAVVIPVPSRQRCS